MYVTGLWRSSNLADIWQTRLCQGKYKGFLPTARNFCLKDAIYPFHKEFGVPSQDRFVTFDLYNLTTTIQR